MWKYMYSSGKAASSLLNICSYIVLSRFLLPHYWLRPTCTEEAHSPHIQESITVLCEGEIWSPLASLWLQEEKEVLCLHRPRQPIPASPWQLFLSLLIHHWVKAAGAHFLSIFHFFTGRRKESFEVESVSVYLLPSTERVKESIDVERPITKALLICETFMSNCVWD